VDPDESVTGTIDQSACGSQYPAHESVEVMPRDGLVVRPADNERGCANLSEPGPAVVSDGGGSAFANEEVDCEFALPHDARSHAGQPPGGEDFPNQEERRDSSTKSGLKRAAAQGVKLGRPKIDCATERKVRKQLAKGVGILKVAKSLGIGTGTVQRIANELR
jgi:hypothetical protein